MSKSCGLVIWLLGVIAQMSSSNLVIGIDASNLRDGGGVTHLVSLLSFAKPLDHGVNQVVVFGGKRILDALPEKPWLLKCSTPMLDRVLFFRLYWQRFKFVVQARKLGCSLLFAPGGSYFGTFEPAVTMSRNMLPFDSLEMRRYGWSARRLRLILLRFGQTKSFKRATGIIFLTKYAQSAILELTGPLKGHVTQIPHGLNARFRLKPRQQLPISEYDMERPFKLLYVSTVDAYKHQWNVVEAVAQLRQSGLPVKLDLVGSAYPPSLRRLKKSMSVWDPNQIWVKYYGSLPHEELRNIYIGADLGVFASSCENMPNILLEKMAAGLPIACAKRGPTPEILGQSGIYFDPESPADISRSIRQLIDSPSLRLENANFNFNLANQYSWDQCAADTFDFFRSVACQEKHEQNP